MKLLIVDDNEELIRLFQVILGRAGFVGLAAANAARARDILTAEKVDVILLDFVLPDVRGFEFLREIRRNYTDVPVLLLSGMGSDDEFAQEARENGAVACVAKAVSPNPLLLEVRRSAAPMA